LQPEKTALISVIGDIAKVSCLKSEEEPLMTKAALIRQNRYKLHNHIIQKRDTGKWWVFPHDPKKDGCITTSSVVVYATNTLQDAQRWLNERYEVDYALA
jgi:hypothetical protein